MKRCMVFTMILILFFTLTAPVYADVPGDLPQDSLTIDDATRETFQLQPGETLYRIYSVSVFSAFKTEDTISDILADQDTNVYYIICSEGGHYRCVNDKLESVTILHKQFENDMPFFLEADAIGKVASDIVVYNTYYLSGKSYNDGLAIYYVTNKGDYIYYKESTCGTGECLFPIDVFYRFWQDVDAWINMHPPIYGGIYLNKIWDLSVYDIHSENFDINASYPRPTEEFRNTMLKNKFLIWGSISLGVCLVVTVLVVLLNCKDKENALLEDLDT